MGDNKLGTESGGIGFYIPEDEIIPTDLRLFYNQYYITYRRNANRLSYNFYVYECDGVTAMSIIREIADMMCEQSEECSGVRWELSEISFVDDARTTAVVIEVEFRVRDSW